MGTSAIDAYDEGLALVVELRRPATSADLEVLRALEREWLGAYETETDQRYRNTGTVGERGAMRLVVWADRIRDPEGHDAAIARCERVAVLARERLSVRSARVTSADEAAADDVEERLGTPLVHVTPGGSASAFLETLARESPSASRSLPALLLAFLARWLPAPWSTVVTGAVLAVALARLTWVTRRRSPPWVYGLAACAGLAALLCAASSVLLPGATSMARVAALFAYFVWSSAWTRARR